MKNLAVIVVIIVLSLSSLLTFGQKEEKNIEFSSASFSSGQGALSCGPLFKSNFQIGEDLITINIGERDIYCLYLKKIGKFYSGPSIEFYHNIPTIGLMTNIPIVTKENFSLSLLNWFATSAGTPGEKADFSNWKLLFFYQAVNLGYKRFSASAAALWYEEWGCIFELKYEQPLTKNISSFVSGGYNFLGDDYIFSLGVSYHL